MEKDRRHISTSVPGPTVTRILGEITGFDKASRSASSRRASLRGRSVADSVKLASAAPTGHERLGQAQARWAAPDEQRVAKFIKDRPMAVGIGVFVPI